MQGSGYKVEDGNITATGSGLGAELEAGFFSAISAAASFLPASSFRDMQRVGIITTIASRAPTAVVDKNQHLFCFNCIFVIFHGGNRISGLKASPAITFAIKPSSIKLIQGSIFHAINTPPGVSPQKLQPKNISIIKISIG